MPPAAAGPTPRPPLAAALGLAMAAVVLASPRRSPAAPGSDLGLPPAEASRRLDGRLRLDRPSFRQLFHLLASPEFLAINLIEAPGVPGLERAGPQALGGLTLGEAMRLLLQLSGTRLRRAGARTFVLTHAEDRREFGRLETGVVRPLRVLPSRVLEFLRQSPPHQRELDPEAIHADDGRGALYLTGRPETLTALRRLVRELDGQAQGLFARIPVSYLEASDLEQALAALPEGRRARLPSWVFNEKARVVVAHGSAEQLAGLQDLVRALDLPRGQVALDLVVLEASEEALSRLGLTLTDTAVEVASLDALRDLRAATPSRLGGRLEALLARSGARSLGRRQLVVQDGETATLQVGEVRNVRVGSVVDGATGRVLTGSTTEVPLGLTLSVTAEVHGDGTATLDLDITDERALAIQEFGIDRSGSSLRTRVRAATGRPLLIAGFGQTQRSRRPQRAHSAERRRSSSRLALLLTLRPDPAAPSPPGSRPPR